MFVDLDRFKLINDTLGHAAGDLLLKGVAQLFKQCLRESDVLARFGGDEFVILLHDTAEITEVTAVARKLLSAAVTPMMIQGRECRVTASIGVATFPDHGTDEQSLTKNADAAMYLAKEEGRSSFRFFAKEIKTQSIERLMLETSLRRALERKEFLLHYQAKRDLATGSISGVEALLRWNHPDLGLVPPLHFIPIAEECGLIVPIGKWVLDTACAQNVAWQRQGLPPLRIAINLSPRQFTDPHLLADIGAALLASGMAPHLLELEITESVVIQNPEQAKSVLAALKGLGVHLSIDDFGTGYSSMSLIKQFPIDTIKVDRSFVRDLPIDANDRAITKTVIALGKALDLTIVAEGVETPAQEEFLREQHCDENARLPVHPAALRRGVPRLRARAQSVDAQGPGDGGGAALSAAECERTAAAPRLGEPPANASRGLAPETAAKAFDPGNGGAAQPLQAPGVRKRRPQPHRDQAVAERAALAPKVVDHRMIGGGAGVGAGDLRCIDELVGKRRGEHDPRRKTRKGFVEGDLPEPGPAAAAQHNGNGDRAPVEQDAADRDLAFRRQGGRGRADEAAQILMTGRGGAGSAFPAARLDDEEVLDRGGDIRGLVGRGEQHGAQIGQAAPEPAQLLMPARPQRRLDVARAVAARHQQRALMTIEIGARHLSAPQNGRERRRERTLLRQKGQQQQAGQLGVGIQMRQPGGDRRLGRFALDQRHAQRRVGMGPAEQNRQSEAVTPPFDPGREKAQQPARGAPRPDQNGFHAATEDRRRRERKSRLVEHVGFERVGGKRPPFR
jgi:diguanylate cyclase (GGDEF)-like protein